MSGPWRRVPSGYTAAASPDSSVCWIAPFTAQEKFYGKVQKIRFTGGQVTNAAVRSAMIAIVPNESATREQAMAEAEAVL